MINRMIMIDQIVLHYLTSVNPSVIGRVGWEGGCLPVRPFQPPNYLHALCKRDI